MKIGQANENPWCCLFTCLTIRAVHIELMPKLDTENCINTIIQFYCAKNQTEYNNQRQLDKLCLAEREFANYVASLNIEEIAEHLIQRGIS